MFVIMVEIMKSHELLREVFQTHNPKQIADQMGLSVSMVYKWAEPPEQGSGTTNPLDRVASLVDATGDARKVEWICTHANGFFIENPKVGRHRAYSLVPATHRVVQDFAEMLSVIASSAVDNNISSGDADRIRERWEELKSVTESFVRACEEGNFHTIRNHERR
jgi:hypothetical protein